LSKQRNALRNDAPTTRRAPSSARVEGTRDLALDALALDTGMREAEVESLPDSDVPITVRTGLVRVYGKGGKPRKIPLQVRTRTLISQWRSARKKIKRSDAVLELFVALGGRRLSARSIDHVIRETGREAGLEISPHVVRYTYATNLVRARIDLVMVAESSSATHASKLSTSPELPTADDPQATVDAVMVTYRADQAENPHQMMRIGGRLCLLTGMDRHQVPSQPNGDDVRHAVWLARLVGFDPSAISRALTAAMKTGWPLPPFTVDSDTGRRVFLTTEFLALWDQRPRPGRPCRSGSEARTTNVNDSHPIDVKTRQDATSQPGQWGHRAPACFAKYMTAALAPAAISSPSS